MGRQDTAHADERDHGARPSFGSCPVADEPLALGCFVRCRVLGAVECSTSEPNGAKVRDDRVIAVPVASIAGAAWNTIADLGERLVREIAEFMASYTRREGRTFTLLGTTERDAALELIRAAQQ